VLPPGIRRQKAIIQPLLTTLIVHASCSVSWVDLCSKERLHGNASLLVREDGDYLVWGSIDEVRPQGRGGLKTTALIGR
jgi:hypothetical protein